MPRDLWQAALEEAQRKLTRKRYFCAECASEPFGVPKAYEDVMELLEHGRNAHGWFPEVARDG